MYCCQLSCHSLTPFEQCHYTCLDFDDLNLNVEDRSFRRPSTVVKLRFGLKGQKSDTPCFCCYTWLKWWRSCSSSYFLHVFGLFIHFCLILYTVDFKRERLAKMLSLSPPSSSMHLPCKVQCATSRTGVLQIFFCSLSGCCKRLMIKKTWFNGNIVNWLGSFAAYIYWCHIELTFYPVRVSLSFKLSSSNMYQTPILLKYFEFWLDQCEFFRFFRA